MEIGKSFRRITAKFRRAFGVRSQKVERKWESQFVIDPPSKLLPVKVLCVFDGDTVLVQYGREEIRVRLASIDSPEGGQEWSEIARAGLIKMIGGRFVHLEEYNVDRFGRTVATIYVEQGKDFVNVNFEMVKKGHAWVEPRYLDQLPVRQRHQLSRIEKWAKAKRVGLWRSKNPTPPWLYRKKSA